MHNKSKANIIFSKAKYSGDIKKHVRLQNKVIMWRHDDK